MLELLIGIPLTIAAWKRGWKGWALLPIPLGLVAGFIAGMIIGSVATTEDEFWGMAFSAIILIYIAEFGVLITMVVKKREPKVTINPVVSPVVSGYQPARFCIGCGQELHDNASFCRNCGQMIGRTLNSDVPLAGQRS